MIRVVFRQIEKRLHWARHIRALSRMRTPEEFNRYVERVRPKDFLYYQKASADKRTEIETVLAALQIDLAGKAALDIGPGHGESLDAFHAHNASDIHFIEYDPFFYTHNRLKGFTKGYYANHLRRMDLLESSRYRFIWAKGSIRVDVFNRFPRLFSLNDWLGEVDRITAPGGIVVICPYWHSRAGRRYEPDLASSAFTRIMLEHGYSVLPPIENHNCEPGYPITFRRIKAV